MKTVTIDPGHGGSDPGAVNGTRYEKNDNLRLGLALRDRLAQLGYNVVMTRSTDINVPLTTRSAISNNNNSDLFISLHRNSSVLPSLNGVANYVQNNSPAINTQYATNVLNEVYNAGVNRRIGVLQDNFSVLRNTRAPAQLLELGFISNPLDNELFDSNFDAYVEAIARGIQISLGDAGGDTGGPSTNTMRNIQQTLNSRYGAGLNADGVFGPLTRRALVKALQQELNWSFGANLVTDGIFGPKTKAAIPTQRLGNRNYLVWLMQAMLYARGYGTNPDGIFGPLTENAVRAFQRDNGLTVDGLAGQNTFARLFG